MAWRRGNWAEPGGRLRRGDRVGGEFKGRGSDIEDDIRELFNTCCYSIFSCGSEVTTWAPPDAIDCDRLYSRRTDTQTWLPTRSRPLH